MRTWPWRGGRRADVHAWNADLVGRQRDPRPEGQLEDVLGTGHDVSADEIRVVGGHLGGGADRHPHNPVPEAWGEPLDLGGDRLCGVTRESVRHMRVRPERVNVSDG